LLSTTPRKAILVVNELDLLRQILDADPVGSRPDAAAEIKAMVFAAPEAALDLAAPHALASETATRYRSRTRRPGRRRRRVLAGGVAAVACAVTAFGVTTLLPTGGGGLGRLAPPSAAAAVLRHAATVAGTVAPLIPGPGEYAYTVTTETYLTDGGGSGGNSAVYWYQQTLTSRTWTASDGSGRTTQTWTQPAFVTPADKARWLAAGQPLSATTPTDHTYGASSWRAAGNLAPTGLPTDPTRLRAALAQRLGSDNRPDQLVATVVGFLDEPGTSPQLRSALFNVLASTPGIANFGTITDGQGRTGQAVGVVAGGVRYAMMYNPASTTLLGVARTVVDPSQITASVQLTPAEAAGLRSDPVGTVLATTTYSAPQIVGSTYMAALS
jgi:hypothetical protein